METLFIVILTYQKSLAEIDTLIPKHVEFLDEHYASGTFLCSGRRVPRTGGIILARSSSKLKLEEIIKRDPFFQKEAANFEIFEFSPTKWSAQFGAAILSQTIE